MLFSIFSIIGNPIFNKDKFEKNTVNQFAFRIARLKCTDMCYYMSCDSLCEGNLGFLIVTGGR